ncbi:Lactonase, 7-bladed beta-propeller-domain-containing protein [Mycena rebaudengoi]|nr:Lactonase, 7-bladed beta-propeller-domain-containing protein [Mycena rebaudengoi]
MVAFTILLEATTSSSRPTSSIPPIRRSLSRPNTLLASTARGLRIIPPTTPSSMPPTKSTLEEPCSLLTSPRRTSCRPPSTLSHPTAPTPAFCAALSTGEVAIMNYSSGNGRIIPTTSSPDQFDNDAPTIVFPPPPPDTPNPNKVSHPHMAVQHGKEVFVPDLGSDMIWRLSPDGKPGVYSITGEIPQPLGSGPRHMRISTPDSQRRPADNRLYVLHELASTLTVQAIPSFPNGTSTIISTASIIPGNPPPGAVWAAAEILIPPPSARFPTQYVYVSNRNTGVQTPTGDPIAIFENVEQGTPRERLQLVTQVFTGLHQIRGMEFGAADDEYLIAGGVAGTAGVVVYRRADGGRALEEVVRNTDVPTRTSFVWKELQS